MKTLKITVADEDGIVLEQYTVRNERELDGMNDEECERAEDEPGVLYLDPSRPHLACFENDVGIFLNRVNED